LTEQPLFCKQGINLNTRTKTKFKYKGNQLASETAKQFSYKRIVHLYTWPIRGRRREEWRTHAAAQAIILAISLSLYSLPSRGSTKASWLPSSNAFIIKGLACRRNRSV